MTIFCRAPYEAVCIHASGKIVPCCATSIDDNVSNAPGNVANFFNNPVFKEIRTALEQGEYPKYCNTCKVAEENKSLSHRKKLNYYLDHCSNKSEPGKLKYLDIAFSNTCNLTCAMCSNKYSSKWNELTKNAPEEILKITNQTRNHTNTLSYSDIDEILDNSADLERIIIKGGEPLYDKKTLYYLENLEKINSTVELNIITNFTVYNEKLISKFPNLNLTLSIDGINDTYEYIRGGNFDVIKENFIKVSKLNRVTYIHFTLSAYNLHQAQQTRDFFGDISAKYNNENNYRFILNIAHNNYLRAGHISEDKYIKAKENQSVLKNISNYSKPSENQIQRFITYTSYLDSIRGFSWHDIEKIY
jgi:organic radical activating enzyme